jgi:hypothetical protein
VFSCTKRIERRADTSCADSITRPNHGHVVLSHIMSCSLNPLTCKCRVQPIIVQSSLAVCIHSSRDVTGKESNSPPHHSGVSLFVSSVVIQWLDKRVPRQSALNEHILMLPITIDYIAYLYTNDHNFILDKLRDEIQGDETSLRIVQGTRPCFRKTTTYSRPEPCSGQRSGTCPRCRCRM